MASRPPRFRPPHSRHLGDGNSVPVDLTSIDADEYRASINGGPQGDDDEDLGTADLFGAFEAVDGDDGVGTATPSSTASMATPTATSGAIPTATATLTMMPTATATPTATLMSTSMAITTATSTTRAQVHGCKTTLEFQTLGTTLRSFSMLSMVRGQGMEPNATTVRKS
jgi:hypothetical protein